ncbi:MAG: hypothetical protein ACXWBM_01770 [Chthoniobacterales bacterium]
MTKINGTKLTKDQIQKLLLSSLGFVALLYVYFSFFLGPLNKSRTSMQKTIEDLQAKLGNSKSEISKADTLEKEAGVATSRFAALKNLSPEGAPIAWFPPRMKLFFANHQIDKATARLDTSTAYKEPELSEWTRYSWMIELPQTDFITAAQAIADLENAEPLLALSKVSLKAGTDDPQFQQVTLVANTAIMKR